MKPIEPILKQQELIVSINKPMKAFKAQIVSNNISLFSSSIQEHYRNVAAPIARGASEIMANYNLGIMKSIHNFVTSYKSDIAQKIQIPIQQMLQNITVNPFQEILDSLKGFDFSKYKKRLNEIVVSESYDAKWFPHAVWDSKIGLFMDFMDVLSSTRKSKNRIKKIDTLIFEYYDKNRIEEMKKSWRKKNIPEYKMRMMHQAVQAYHRREYAITVVVLSTLWEGIIYDKAHDTRGKNGRRTKEDFEKLMTQTEYNVLFQSFFNEYIMYDCRSVEDVKEDVPGRNSSAHSWYSKYPSRKAGLNAILFTDFLLKLEPIEKNSVL